MLRLSANLKAAEHNEDPDSPRSPPPAPTAAAALHSMQPAQYPGYHSNSVYRPPVVNHHIINTHTHVTHRWQAKRWLYMCTHIPFTHTPPHVSVVTHILNVCACARALAENARFHTITHNLIAVFLMRI